MKKNNIFTRIKSGKVEYKAKMNAIHNFSVLYTRRRALAKKEIRATKRNKQNAAKRHGKKFFDGAAVLFLKNRV